MKRSEFTQSIMETIPVGKVMNNPGGGTSTIVAYSQNNITYLRGHSKIVVSFDDLYDAFQAFCGDVVDSSMLKHYKPRVFDSRRGGHSCNSTFFFMVLQELGIIKSIKGKGRRGDPFRIYIPNHSESTPHL